MWSFIIEYFFKSKKNEENQIISDDNLTDCDNYFTSYTDIKIRELIDDLKKFLDKRNNSIDNKDIAYVHDIDELNVLIQKLKTFIK